MKYIKICPKCKSLKIKLRWQSFWFYGFPPSYQCLNCGYKGRLFPEVDAAKIKKWKKIKTGKK